MKRVFPAPLLSALLLVLGCAVTAASRADVAFIVILTVPEENTAAFDELATRMVAASAEDKGLLVYEFSRVGTTVYGYERYTDEAAHDRHEAILAPLLPELTALAEFNSIVTLTPLSDTKEEAMAAIGAMVGTPVAGATQGSLGEPDK